MENLRSPVVGNASSAQCGGEPEESRPAESDGAAELQELPPLPGASAAPAPGPAQPHSKDNDAQLGGLSAGQVPGAPASPVLPPALALRLQASRRRRSFIMQNMETAKDSDDAALARRLETARRRRSSAGSDPGTPEAAPKKAYFKDTVQPKVETRPGKLNAPDLGDVFVQALKADGRGSATVTPSVLRARLDDAASKAAVDGQKSTSSTSSSAKRGHLGLVTPRFTAFRPDLRPLLPSDIAQPTSSPRCFTVSNLTLVEIDCEPVLNTHDSYIFVSFDAADKDGALSATIWTWIGQEAEADKRFICAYCAVGMKSVLADQNRGGMMRICREEPGHETPAFLSLFPLGILDIDQGPGLASGLYQTLGAPGDHRRYRGQAPGSVPRAAVYRWHRGRMNHCAPVLCRNGGAVYLLDLEHTGIIIYCGRDPKTHVDKLQASIIARSRMLSIDRGGDGKVWVLEEDRRHVLDDEEELQGWDLLSRLDVELVDEDAPAVSKLQSTASPRGNQGKLELYRIEAAISLRLDIAQLKVAVMPGKARPNLIPDRTYLGSSKAVSVIDTGTELLVYVGAGAGKKGKKLARELLAKLVAAKPRVTWTEVKMFREHGGPTTESWRQKFEKWQDGSVWSPRKAMPVPRPLPHVDWDVLEKPPMKRSESVLDSSIARMKGANSCLQSIATFIFDHSHATFVNRPDRRPMGTGVLFDTESVIFLCIYKLGKRTACTAYFWEGRHASALASACFVQETRKELAGAIQRGFGCRLDVVQIAQGSEPEQLLAHFGGVVVLHRGNDVDSTSRAKLIQLSCGVADGSVRAAEVPCQVDRLTSRDCFLLIAPASDPLLWIGRGTSVIERARAREAAKRILGHSRPAKDQPKYLVSETEPCETDQEGEEPFIVIQQGKELEEFWSVFEAPPSPDIKPCDTGFYFSPSPRLFIASCSKGYYSLEEPDRMDRSFLRSDVCALLDPGFPAPVRIWIGKETSPVVHRWTRLAAERWLDKTGDGRWFAARDHGAGMGLFDAPGHIAGTAAGVQYEEEGYESPEFMAYFVGWDERQRECKVTGKAVTTEVRREVIVAS